MSVVKIHTDDLQSIYDILGNLLNRPPGRLTKAAADDLRNRAMASSDLVGTILGIKPGIEAAPVMVSRIEEDDVPVEPTPAPAEELTVEEVVAAIGKDITPEVGPLADAPEAVVEGDQA